MGTMRTFSTALPLLLAAVITLSPPASAQQNLVIAIDILLFRIRQ